VDQLLAQLTSVITLVVFCSIMCYLFFTIMDKTMGMRVEPEVEIAGLDMPLMGALAYPDFLEAQGSVFVPLDDVVVGKGGNGGAARLREEVGA
jgi:Amt family ammonium transporter